MTDETQPIRYKRTDAPGRIHGVPNGDLTQHDLDRLPPDLRREVKASALYAAVGTDEARDPLGELDNAAYDALSPPEKGARTREAKRRAAEAEVAREEAQRREDEQREAERLEREALAAAEADAAARAANQADETGSEDGA